VIAMNIIKLMDSSPVKFLLAIVLIIAASNLCAWLAGRFSQPRVIGEMLAGIALGPSVLGQLAPKVQRWLFPAQLIPHLHLISQPAIAVFVFLVGANLPLALLRGSGRTVTALGVGMVIVPAACGILLAGGLLEQYRPDDIGLGPFVLFVGVLMGVTALPVLARILDEHGLLRLKVGALGLTIAGIGDAIAWCLLIVAVAAIHKDSAIMVIWTFILLATLAGTVWILLRPALRAFLTFAEKSPTARVSAIPILLFSAMVGGFIANWIGVHSLFGALMVGMALPRANGLIQDLTKALERGVAAILPLFFATVGISLKIDSLPSRIDVAACGLLVAVAMASKIGATVLIARFAKLGWRNSLGLGVMMNCRGLTEIVMITTGLSLGVIGQKLFAMFVVMTLVTTMMTGPLLSRLKLDRKSSPYATT
jgi:Kef-type K+ transport system membrane component KefB